MKKSIIILCSFILFLPLFSFAQIPASYSNEDFELLVEETEQAEAMKGGGIRVVSEGQLFLGGKPPVIKRVLVTKELKKNDKTFYKIKVIIGRATGDRSGTYPILKAKRYRDAFAKLIGLSPGIKSTIDLFFPKAIDTRKFPTLNAVFDYTILVPGHGINKGKKNAKGKKAFVEHIAAGQSPGARRLVVQSCVEIDPNHPFVRLFDVVEMFKTILAPEAALVDALVAYATRTGLTTTIIKTIIANKAKCTSSTFEFDVKAKVPNLKGKKPSQAIKALQSRNLVANLIKKNGPNKVAKVTKQSVKPGKFVKAGTVVNVTYTVKQKPPPDEIDGVIGLWRFGNGTEFKVRRGNAGFKCFLTKLAPVTQEFGFKRGELTCRGMTPVGGGQFVGEQKFRYRDQNKFEWRAWNVVQSNANTLTTTSGGFVATRLK